MGKVGRGDRRAQLVAGLGFVLQLVALAAMLLVASWSNSDAARAVARLIVLGLPAWAILFLTFKQLRRVSTEALETEELKRIQGVGAGSLFGAEEEALHLERNRLGWMVRWMLPSVTVLISGCLIGGHFVLWNWRLDSAFQKDGLSLTQHPTLVMWFVVGIGFVSFLYARYTLALARIPGWELMHAGGTYMAGVAVSCVGLAVALMSGAAFSWIEPLFAYIVRLFLLVLGVELAGNFVLDLYRPRVAGEVPRPSFDSRLLGLIGDPGGIAKSIAEAINYQFGFEVSSTWFYQLLHRWLFPITIATIVVVLAMTCVVIVDADEQAIVEHLGSVEDGGAVVLNPGLHFKWPFPIDIVKRAPVKRVGELVIGEVQNPAESDMADKAILWTETHEYVPELMLLVAAPKLGESSTSGMELAQTAKVSRGVAVNLLMVSVPIAYRIKDVREYLYSYDKPEALLEAIAYRYLSDYAAGVDVDELIGPGRARFNRELGILIQRRLDELGVGIEIVFAGIRDAHPPARDKVAIAYQGVISSQIRRAATIHAAEGEAQRMLTAVAGTESRALEVDEAIRNRDRLEQDGGADPAARLEAQKKVDLLFEGDTSVSLAPMSGRAAAHVSRARAKANDLIGWEASKAQSFATEISAYQAAPALYMQRKALDTFSEINSIRKYLIVGNPEGIVVEYETTEQGGLDRVLTEGLEKERKKRN